jgi:drug/metabolite transporter (DMT)-like permease
MRNNRVSLLALASAGLLWGTTVPLTKLALGWLGPGWLTVARFALAAVLLAGPVRHRLRAAVTPATIGWGAFGYGMVIVLQNAGIARTSVSHAALLVGATPILVALMAVALRRSVVGAVSWAGFAVALGGVGLIAADGGGSATLAGDGLVLASLLLSAGFVVAQPAMLSGRDPFAVTAVQFAAAAVASLPVAAWLDPAPGAPAGWVAVLSVAGLVVGGTLVPFTLFAYGQARVAPEVAGAFLNLEPVVGAVAGTLAFGDPAGVAQMLGGIAVLTGIALTAAPLVSSASRRSHSPCSSVQTPPAPGPCASGRRTAVAPAVMMRRCGDEAAFQGRPVRETPEEGGRGAAGRGAAAPAAPAAGPRRPARRPPARAAAVRGVRGLGRIR